MGPGGVAGHASLLYGRDLEEGEDRIHAAYGDNYGRLLEIKRKWDPDNLFRMNKNIGPGES